MKDMKDMKEIKDFKVLFFFPNEPLVGVTPSNLAILSAVLKKEGFQTKLFDCTSYASPREDQSDETQDEKRTKLGHSVPTEIDKYIKVKEENVYDAFVRTVEEYKPDIIGITLVDSTIQFSYNFLEKIKHLNIPVVTGGVGSTFNYMKLLRSGLIDYVCIGEGDEVIVELCDRLHKKEDPSDVRNICLLDKEGNLIKNKMRPLADIETLPLPDFSIYDDERFYRPFRGEVVRMAQIDFDRGCPYTCTYCAAPALTEKFREEGAGHYYRVKTLDVMFAEMKALIKKYNLNFLYLSSETLLIIPRVKFRELARRYKEEINLPFWCQTRLDSFDEEKSKLLKEMGCQAVSIGLEHGSEELRRKLLSKKITNKTVYNAFKLMAKYDIFPTINCMLGLPDETREEVFETIRVNRRISKILKGKHNTNVFTFIPFYGTALRNISVSKGYIDKDEDIPFDWYKKSMLTMPSMSADEIYGLEKTIPMYINMPKKYYPQIKIAEAETTEGLAMFDKLVKIMIKQKTKKIKGDMAGFSSSISATDATKANPYGRTTSQFQG
jgi:radical SAM superfamily enzyme YgiQ (UPF0313 family)